MLPNGHSLEINSAIVTSKNKKAGKELFSCFPVFLLLLAYLFMAESSF
jgi:hypothetical protein